MVLSEAVKGLRAKGATISMSQNNGKLATIGFRYQGKMYTISCNSKDAASQVDEKAHSTFTANELKGLDAEIIKKYFQATVMENGKTTKYAFKEDCGYTSLSQLKNDLYQQYKNDLILDNFLAGRGMENSTGLMKTESGKYVTSTNFTQLADEIKLATGEEEARLKYKALDKFITEFASGNVTTIQALNILKAIGVENIQRKDTKNLYVYTFETEHTKYTVKCNKAAAKSAVDDNNSVTMYQNQIMEKYSILGEDMFYACVEKGLIFQSVDGKSDLCGCMNVEMYSISDEEALEAYIKDLKEDFHENNNPDNWATYQKDGKTYFDVSKLNVSDLTLDYLKSHCVADVDAKTGKVLGYTLEEPYQDLQYQVINGLAVFTLTGIKDGTFIADSTCLYENKFLRPSYGFYGCMEMFETKDLEAAQAGLELHLQKVTYLSSCVEILSGGIECLGEQMFHIDNDPNYYYITEELNGKKLYDAIPENAENFFDINKDSITGEIIGYTLKEPYQDIEYHVVNGTGLYVLTYIKDGEFNAKIVSVPYDEDVIPTRDNFSTDNIGSARKELYEYLLEHYAKRSEVTR